MNPERVAGQIASTVFQVFTITGPGIEPCLPSLVARAPKLVGSDHKTIKQPQHYHTNPNYHKKMCALWTSSV